jgi:hypothetical protein
MEELPVVMNFAGEIGIFLTRRLEYDLIPCCELPIEALWS